MKRKQSFRGYRTAGRKLLYSTLNNWTKGEYRAKWILLFKWYFTEEKPVTRAFHDGFAFCEPLRTLVHTPATINHDEGSRCDTHKRHSSFQPIFTSMNIAFGSGYSMLPDVRLSREQPQKYWYAAIYPGFIVFHSPRRYNASPINAVR